MTQKEFNQRITEAHTPLAFLRAKLAHKGQHSIGGGRSADAEERKIRIAGVFSKSATATEILGNLDDSVKTLIINAAYSEA